jgi:hypothetical protein
MDDLLNGSVIDATLHEIIHLKATHIILMSYDRHKLQEALGGEYTAALTGIAEALTSSKILFGRLMNWQSYGDTTYFTCTDMLDTDASLWVKASLQPLFEKHPLLEQLICYNIYKPVNRNCSCA